MAYEFVIDEYTVKRGEPQILELSCSNCNEYLMTYQKDGPGPLLRCYWDRIHAPPHLHQLKDFKDELVCPHCHNCIGQKGIYEKENREAFFLIEGSLTIKEEEKKHL